MRPQQIAIAAAFRDALAETARGVKPLLRRRWVFDNATATDGRGCPTDALARAYDDALDALKAAPIDPRQRLEQALAIPRAMELAARARFAPAPVLSLTDVLLAEGRADAVAQPLEQDVLADPACPAKRHRLLVAWQHHRAKLDAGLHWLQRHAHLTGRGAA